MFQFLRNVIARQPAEPRTQPKARLAMEALEDRLLPANYLVLDFTPDSRHASFASAFNLRYTNGTAPAFLDMDGDRRITTNDVNIAATAISNRVAALLKPFNIQVLYGDVLQNTNLGTTWLKWGVSQPGHQVFNIRIGGFSGMDSANGYTTGIAPQAPPGYNNETYGNTFASSITHCLMRSSGITANRFIISVAATTVHEFGHLVGLGHTSGHPTRGVNIMSYGTDDAYAYIPNASYVSDLVDTRGNRYRAYQNPAYEVALSLAGQYTFAAYGVNHYKVVTTKETMQVGELHGDDHADEKLPEVKAQRVASKPRFFVHA